LLRFSSGNARKTDVVGKKTRKPSGVRRNDANEKNVTIKNFVMLVKGTGRLALVSKELALLTQTRPTYHLGHPPRMHLRVLPDPCPLIMAVAFFPEDPYLLITVVVLFPPIDQSPLTAPVLLQEHGPYRLTKQVVPFLEVVPGQSPHTIKEPLFRAVIMAQDIPKPR
jgi:hypothetical protein